MKCLVAIKLLYPLAFLFPPDAVWNLFSQLAHSNFTGFPNLMKTAKVAIFFLALYEFDTDFLIT